MAGFLLILMGIFRLGAVIRFIPAPVIVGFTAGIGVIIWVGQWPSFFGVSDPEGEHFHETLPSLVASLPDLHVATTLLATLGLAILILAPKVPALARIPAPLIAMVVVTLLYRAFQLDGVETIGSRFGGIPQGLPTWAPPDVSVGLIIDLLGPALTIAMLAAIESLLSAVVADGMSGTRHDSNQELTGQGIANIASSLFGGIAATGAIARTATNIRNGGTSPIAGIANVVVLVAIVLVLAPLAADVPLAVLAAILFVVAWNMSELRHFARMVRRAPVADVAVLVTTFVLTVFADLVIAVNIGVLLATLHFLRRMAASVDVHHIGEGRVTNEPAAAHTDVLPHGVVVFAIDGPFFFAAVDSFERALASTHTDPHMLIIRLGRVPFMDITGIQGLEGVITDLQGRGVRVKLCEANPRVAAMLKRAGILRMVGEENVFESVSDALATDVVSPGRTGDDTGWPAGSVETQPT